MLKALIVDDSPRIRKTVAKLLEEYCPEVNILGFAGNATEAKEQLSETKANLVLLDIEMPNGSGFDFLDQTREFDFEVIFVTAFNQYALKAIKFAALDYLLKPIDPEALAKAVQKAKKRLGEKLLTQRISHFLNNLRTEDPKKHVLPIPTLSGYEFIRLEDIIRCEADGSYTNFVLINGSTFTSSQRLGSFEELLSERGFFRIHRSHMINTGHVRRYHKGSGGIVVMMDGSELGVARQKKEGLLGMLQVS